MATLEGARRTKRAGQLIAVFGGFVGLAVWLIAFTGELSHGGIFVLPIGVGGFVSGVGMILERSAKQPDVGRQMRQP